MSRSSPSEVRRRWQHVNTIARRAGSDDTSSERDLAGANHEEKAKLRERKMKQKKEREEYAKIMGLEYFLEMVSVTMAATPLRH